jgi:hypothetical protein
MRCGCSLPFRILEMRAKQASIIIWSNLRAVVGWPSQDPNRNEVDCCDDYLNPRNSIFNPPICPLYSRQAWRFDRPALGTPGQPHYIQWGMSYSVCSVPLTFRGSLGIRGAQPLNFSEAVIGSCTDESGQSFLLADPWSHRHCLLET